MRKLLLILDSHRDTERIEIQNGVTFVTTYSEEYKRIVRKYLPMLSQDNTLRF